MLKRIALPWTTIYASSETQEFLPAMPWMQASEFSSLRVTYEVRGRLGNLRVVPAFQVADVEDTPISVTSCGTQTSSNGMVYPTTWASPTLNNQLVRLGWYVDNTSGTDLSMAPIAGVLEIKTCS